MKFIPFALFFILSFSLRAQINPQFEFDTDKQNILAMDISPDGKWLACGGDDNQVIFRDPNNGQKLFSLTGQNDWVTAICFSSIENNKRPYFISGSRDGNVIVYEIDKRNILFQNKAHDNTINHIVILNSLNYLAVVSSDGFMSIVDLNTKQQVNKIKVSDEPVLGVCEIPGTNNLATSDAQGKIKFWDALTGNMEKVINADDAYIRDIDIINGNIISVSDDKSIKSWSLESGAQNLDMQKTHKKWIQIIKPLNDKTNHFATGGHGGNIYLWQHSQTEPIFEAKQDGNFVSGIAFSPNLNTMYCSGYGGKIHVFDISEYALEPMNVYTENSMVTRSSANRTGISERNEIELIQPFLSSSEPFYVLEDKIKIKGKVFAKSSIREFRISNLTTKESDRLRTQDDNAFEHEIALRYKNNDIRIRFKLANGDSIVKDIVVHRIFDPKNEDDLIKIKRNGQDYALIIATNEYENMTDLTNPVFDANTIAAELEENFGFNVEKLVDPELDDIKLKIKEYSKKIYADEDQLFIFIAGHGEYDELFKEGYLVAKNTKYNDEARSSYLPHSTLRTYVNNIPCDHIFLTMDVCFGGTFDPFISKRGNEITKEEQIQKLLFIKRKLQYKTRIYLTSGGKEYVPDGRPGHHSPFARKFIESLRTYGGSDGILTYKDIMGNVETVSPEPRTGEFGDNEPGSDFLFIYK